MGILNENLTDKQELFCQYYIAETDFNATSAAKKAGYSQDTAQEISAENLSKPIIQARIKELMADRMARLKVTQDWVVNELKKVAGANMHDYADWNGDKVDLVDSETLTEDQTAAVASLNKTVTKDGGSIGFKLHDKVKALEMLGKHLKMFTDKIDLGGQKDNPIQAKYDYSKIPTEKLREVKDILSKARVDDSTDARD
jgi:phage terminase small subunit